MTIYLDLFFFINFIINAMLIKLSCPYRKISFLRITASAFFGTAYACMCLIMQKGFLYSLPVKLFTVVLMCMITIFPSDLKMLLKHSLMFVIISVVMCGCINTLLNICGFYGDIHTASNLSDKILFVACVVAFTAIKFLTDFSKKQLLTDSCRIKITYNNRSVTFYGICDTGNSLTDPITGYPVIMVDIKYLKKLFSRDLNANSLCEFVDAKDFKVIPYKTISQKGLIYGFSPHSIEINENKQVKAIVAAAPININYPALANPILF